MPLIKEIDLYIIMSHRLTKIFKDKLHDIIGKGAELNAFIIVAKLQIIL